MFNQTIDGPIDHLEQELVARERVIGRFRSEQAGLVRTLDAAQVATMDGARSKQEWTASWLDVSDATARDLMLAARSLGEKPEMARCFDDGEVSFERAVAATRLALAGADAETLEASFGFDLNGVARVASRHRRLTRRAEERVFRDRFLAIQRPLMRNRVDCRGGSPASSCASSSRRWWSEPTSSASSRVPTQPISRT